jgi:O-antigen biosynthesis protein
VGRPAVSVVVASLGRPNELDRCLAALDQLFYRPYEIVVVACADGQRAIARHLGPAHVRVLDNDGSGVAAARNHGIAAASGEIVAFIDDDAVPEPTWLDHLVWGMEQTGAGAATGFVRGRNGISFQWRGRTVRTDGYHGTIPLSGDEPFVSDAASGAAMTEGTNMAIRRDLLARIGGFDSAFRFYLDDADIALRVAASGSATVVVPLAQVHHGFAASSRRRADRMPTDLFDVGRSLGLFLRKHHDECDLAATLALHRLDERRRLVRYMVSGQCDPRDVTRLLTGFDDGAQAGVAQPFGLYPAAFPASIEGVMRVDDGTATARVLAGRSWGRGRLREQAAAAAQDGHVPSLFCLGPTALYHRVRYDRAGYWEQTGGIFGRSDRSQPVFRLLSFRERVAQEAERVAKVRGIFKKEAIS